MVLDGVSSWVGSEVVVTTKMDGENTTVYSDGYLHARSIDGTSHPSRSLLKAEAAGWATLLPEGWRVCGENLYAQHSLSYDALHSYFQVFSIWEADRCLSWPETVEWCELLELHTVPVLWSGSLPLTEAGIESHLSGLWSGTIGQEGYVVRPARSFDRSEFGTLVGKYVRPGHVTSDQHWSQTPVVPNRLA